MNYNIFDVISTSSKLCAENFKKKNSKLNVTIEEREQIGELIPKHYIIKVDDMVYANIYESQACYAYNKIKIGKKIVNIGTIFTILSFYLIFLFTNDKEYDKNRITCTSHMLQNIYLRNRTKNSGLLKVYTAICIGNQLTLEDILTEKRNKFKQLKKSDKEYEKWFLKYAPKGSTKVIAKTKKKKTKK